MGSPPYQGFIATDLFPDRMQPGIDPDETLAIGMGIGREHNRRATLDRLTNQILGGALHRFPKHTGKARQRQLQHDSTSRHRECEFAILLNGHIPLRMRQHRRVAGKLEGEEGGFGVLRPANEWQLDQNGSRSRQRRCLARLQPFGETRR